MKFGTTEANGAKGVLKTPTEIDPQKENERKEGEMMNEERMMTADNQVMYMIIIHRGITTRAENVTTY